MGGAFGGKEVQANPWAAVAALGAWKTRRPVRVRLPRDRKKEVESYDGRLNMVFYLHKITTGR